jgi:Xaa-Pro dipeptidase
VKDTVATTFEQALAGIRDERTKVRAIEPSEFAQRRERAQRIMDEAGLDAVILTAAGASLRYFTGCAWGMYERFTGAILPRKGEPVFIVPGFEEPRLRLTAPNGASFRAWQEDESPYGLCGTTLRDLGAATGRVALDESTPYFIADGLAKAAPQLRLESAAPVVARCRAQKSTAEIDLIQHAMNVTLEIHRIVHACLREGTTTKEIVEFMHAAHIAAGSDSGSTFAIVAFAEQTAYPHGPEAPQTLREGDLVLVDTGCTFHGYHSDLTRTYVFGQPTPRQREVWETEREAQQAAFAALRRGGPSHAPDDAARRVLESRGYGPDYKTPGLPHRAGHGIGLEIHERPYLVRGNTSPLLPGMCASIEPMLCLYGEMGVRLEDHFYMTESGPQWFTRPSTNLDEPFGG